MTDFLSELLNIIEECPPDSKDLDMCQETLDTLYKLIDDKLKELAND